MSVITRRVLFALVLATSSAHADPASVLVADEDPELLHALQSSLAPYRFVVISDPGADDDPARIADVAQRANARFVVWREDDQLVVFDRETGSTERRPARGGRLDAPDAAAAALTVKTLMRLPDSPEEPPVRDESMTANPDVVSGPSDELQERWRIRVHASAMARSTGAGTEPAVQLGVAFRPRVGGGWRYGVAGDLGAASTVEAAGFTGTWREVGAFAVISWAHDLQGSDRGFSPVLEIEPFLAAGVVGGTLTVGKGPAMTMDPIDETSWMPALRGGLNGWWTPTAVHLGASVYVEGRASTPTYTKETQGMGQPEVFAARSYAVGFGVVIGIELGP